MVESIERYTELPLMILALAMIPLLLGHVLFDLSDDEQRVFAVLGIVIWALFATDLVVKVAISPDRPSYLKRRWVQVIIVVLPFFRPLMVLRLVAFGSRAFVGARRVFHVNNLILLATGTVFVSATVLLAVEQGKNPQIETFSDAIWWSFVTISTVGYGDTVPTTVAGKAVAVVVMLGGIILFSALAGNLASMLTRGEREEEMAENEAEQQALRNEMHALRQDIAELRSGRSPG
jgi:voltage-gated potassium channel